MALTRIQTLIVKNLHHGGQLSAAQFQAIVAAPDELSGDGVDQLLLQEYHISEFRLLMAKGRAFGMTPIDVSKCIVDPRSFIKLELGFCRENQVLPLGFCGDFALVAMCNPFDLSLISKIKELCQMQIRVLLGLKSAIKLALKALHCCRF